MKKLSYWGMMNPLKTQFIITISLLSLSILGIYSGIWLFAQDIILPNFVFYTGLTLFFIGFACYPIYRARYAFWKTTFAKQKTMDTILLFSSMLITITFSNREANIAWKTAPNPVQNVQIVFKEPAPNALQLPAKQLTFKEKCMKKYTQFVIKKKLMSESLDGGSVAGIVLIVLLMLVLMAGVAILACSATCSGSSVGAVVILVSGWALIITGGIYLIRRLIQKSKNNYQPMPETPK
jgi:hypothetical protein